MGGKYGPSINHEVGGCPGLRGPQTMDYDLLMGQEILLAEEKTL
jgi:hypothetical protein